MEKRKVQKTGGSTYIVSLPKDWARERLEAGDDVFVEKDDDSLKIALSEKEDKKTKTTLNYEEPLDSLLRKVISRYLIGYDRIEIKSEGVMKRREEIEKLVRENLMGTEVTQETSDRIELQNLLRYSDLPTKEVLSRIDSVIKSMYRDVISYIEEGDEKLKKDIMGRENEIDRFYLLAVRQLKGATKDPNIRRKLGLGSKLLCLGYRIVCKSLERIGDHLKRIPQQVPETIGDEERSRLVEIGKRSFGPYRKIVEALFEVSDDKAEEAIQMVKKADRFQEKTESELSSSHSMRSALESFQRIRALTTDIGEIVINFSAEGIEGES